MSLESPEIYGVKNGVTSQKGWEPQLNGHQKPKNPQEPGRRTVILDPRR